MFNRCIMKIKKLQDSAKIPTKNENDAGYDLYCIEPVTILPGHRCKVSTGIALAIPKGCVGLIWPRSGLSAKNGIDVLAGVIDNTYRGDIIVCLLNTSTDTFAVPAGSKIAQIIIQEFKEPQLELVEELNETERNDKGFGSSGV